MCRNLLKIGVILASLLICTAFRCPITLDMSERWSNRASKGQSAIASTKEIFRSSCFTGESSSIDGCCRGKSCPSSIIGWSCKCDTSCKGWSANIGPTAGYKFDTVNVKDRNAKHAYEADDACVNVDTQDTSNPLAIRVNYNSCVKVWEKNGCSGRHVKLQGESIPDIRTRGLPHIHSVSGCDFSGHPIFAKLELYQHFTDLEFGKSQEIYVVNGECKFVGEWWNDRASRIYHGSRHCYKIWEHGDCTGAGLCVCGAGYAFLDIWKMRGETSWNDQVSAVSTCQYQKTSVGNVAPKIWIGSKDDVFG